MSSLVADILIYLLLLAGVGFGAISLMGLLIFPDIHSRMYTALRAGVICMAGIAGAAVIYAFTLLPGAYSDLYLTFLSHVLIFAGMAGLAVTVISRQIKEKTKALVYRGIPQSSSPEKQEKSDS